MTGIERIAAERMRQIKKEGWTYEHDNAHEKGELTAAAACYALENYDKGFNIKDFYVGYADILWPWDIEWWKPSLDKIRNLEKAGALIAAEIDRLLRMEVRHE